MVKRAVKWGHSAVAITDHGVVQSFPDAWHEAKGKIKILYGMEGYFVNDLDDRVVVHGPLDQDFDGEIVCFDIETTGLNVATEAITRSALWCCETARSQSGSKPLSTRIAASRRRSWA